MRRRTRRNLHKPESAGAKLVTFLLDSGLDIEEEGGSGSDLCKPIWFATAFGRNATVVKLLIKRGAQPTGLYAAGWWDDMHILKLLIDAGADKEVVVGVTPFLACWGWKRFKAAKALALKGANVNVQDKRGRTALHIGIEKEFDPALLKWLVQHGASPDIPDREGMTARAEGIAQAEQEIPCRARLTRVLARGGLRIGSVHRHLGGVHRQIDAALNHQFQSATLRFDVSGDEIALTQFGVNMSGKAESSTLKFHADRQERPVSPQAPGIVVLTRWLGTARPRNDRQARHRNDRPRDLRGLARRPRPDGEGLRHRCPGRGVRAGNRVRSRVLA